MPAGPPKPIAVQLCQTHRVKPACSGGRRHAGFFMRPGWERQAGDEGFQMFIETKEVQGVRMHLVRGELVHESKEKFLTEMYLRTGRHKFEVMNLWGLEFVDSGGIGALVTLAAHLKKMGIPLWLYKVNPFIKKVLENTRVAELFRFSNSLDVILGNPGKDIVGNAAVQ
jgi:anti-anti-sigma factor